MNDPVDGVKAAPPPPTAATPLPAATLPAPHTPSADVYHTLWNFAPTNRSHGFGAFGHTGHTGAESSGGGPGGGLGGLGDQYALPFGAGLHGLMGASPSDETIYWDNFNLAPNDLLGMSMSHDVDFGFNVDDTMQQHMGSEPTVVVDTSITEDNDMSEPAVPGLAALSPAAVASGHKAYQRSPWLFIPVAQDHAYSESQALSVDEQMLERQLRAESTEVRQQQQQQQLQNAQNAQQRTRHSSPSSSLPRPMDATARDAILVMATEFSKTTTSIRSFPSCDLLNVFVKAYFVREASRPDPWIHAPTLHAGEDRCRTELLAAIVAGGAILFAPPKVWKMGLALQEIVKLAIRSAVDNDNRLTRNLQVFQAFVLWVEIALWSGHRRKMEIGEGFASSIITMLRRAGTFHQGYYAPLSLPESVEGHDEEWAQSWLHWVRQQSFKRLALHLFMTEMRASIAFSRSPMISVAELSFGLPASRDLWDASDAQEWKARYLAKRSKSISLTVVDGMYNISHFAAEVDGIDLGLGSLAILYGFWCPVWAYLDARATSYLANTAMTNTANNSAAGAARRQELYHAIQTTSLKLRSLQALCPEGQLVGEFLMMSLHASFEDMQRFAGRYGVDEFKQALPRLQEWAHSDDQYYTAAWHAGQVLRAARAFAPTLLRGFPAVAVYQACLTLLVFAVFARFRSSVPDSFPSILLDGEETMDVRTYLRTGHGRPRLLVSDQARDLDNPVVIATVMAETFRSNYPSSSDSLPPLLDSLASLMGDICKTFVAE
ncbi:hypothetical protein SBRCBS47491_002489 [Sporothrix bragantina]|uniref:Xylanolytic transcriptional activator regulatory domain-containing protein n=1 Tax=Sporothrix bragantina TaxID=671064 RepID=A0ABP0B7A0_9PEZI